MWLIWTELYSLLSPSTSKKSTLRKEAPSVKVSWCSIVLVSILLVFMSPGLSSASQRGQITTRSAFDQPQMSLTNGSNLIQFVSFVEDVFSGFWRFQSGQVRNSYLPMIKMLCPLKKEEKLTIFPYWFSNLLTTWILQYIDKPQLFFFIVGVVFEIGNCKQTAEMITNCLPQKTFWLEYMGENAYFFTVGC